MNLNTSAFTIYINNNIIDMREHRQKKAKWTLKTMNNNNNNKIDREISKFYGKYQKKGERTIQKHSDFFTRKETKMEF